MKKLIAILLSLTFVLSVSVLAASTDPSSQSSSKEVKAKYSTSLGAPIYSVDIKWGSMEFVYSTTGKWNPTSHTYTTSSSGTWSCDENANVVTITNHSNAEINCDVSFTPYFEGEISGEISSPSIVIPSADGKELTDPEITKSSTLTLKGNLKSIYDGEYVGSVTVNISGT